MTPTERRDTLALEVSAHIEFRVGVGWWACQCGATGTNPDGLIHHRADAHMPKVEEWLAVAWDEGYAAMGDESRPIGEPIVNPYRRDKT